jgi:hypothetical protein
LLTDNLKSSIFLELLPKVLFFQKNRTFAKKAKKTELLKMQE